MKTLSLSEAKMKLSALVEEVHGSDQEVVITKNGVPVAVLVSPDEFEGWRETLAIRLDQDSLSEIREGLSALEGGRASLFTLDELFDEGLDLASNTRTTRARSRARSRGRQGR